jgi:hypothetical protein
MASQSIAQSGMTLKILQRLLVQYLMSFLLLFSALIMLGGLTGCHLLTMLRDNSVAMAPNLNTLGLDTISGVASVHCTGGVGCQFISLNGVKLVEPVVGELTEENKMDMILRFESPVSNDGSQYYLALPAAPHDVEVAFFPVANARVERFTLTHHFKANHRYDLKLYRQEREESASLLSLAGPAPLCIDLLDDNRVDRRFCRDYGFQTMTTSFVEQKIK